jgi:glutamate--cysteine ligase catalytic subunit
MDRAHHRDSVRQEKFHFRDGVDSRLMSINEIINGTDDFLGLVPLVQQYLNEFEEIDSDTRLTVNQYLSLISKRAAGIYSTFLSYVFY